MRVVWQSGKDIKSLIKRTGDFENWLYSEVFKICESMADTGQAMMRIEAPWTDRTGNARAGLVGVARREGKSRFVIYLVHTVEYGIYLELGRSGRYAIVYPVLVRLAPQVMAEIRAFLKG